MESSNKASDKVEDHGEEATDDKLYWRCKDEELCKMAPRMTKFDTVASLAKDVMIIWNYS